MLAKNIDKEKRKNRLTWSSSPYYQRTTPTKKDKQQKIVSKHKITKSNYNTKGE